jgi:opacity protein-like surface antigen
MNRAFAALAAITAATLGIASSAPALADPKEVRLGGDSGYALLAGSQSMSGYGFGVRAAYGLTWEITLVLEARYSKHIPTTKHGQMVAVLSGVEWALDVLRFVPFFSVESGAYFAQDPAFGSTTDVGLALGIGVDYRVNRSFSVGLYGRYHLVASNVNKFPAYVDSGLRFAFHFD